MSLQPFHVRGGLDADGKRVMHIADPIAVDDAVNLRTLRNTAGAHFAARMSNLPSPQDPNVNQRPLDGALYFVKYGLDGNAIDRLFIYDSNRTATGPVAQLIVESDDPADAAVITALAGTADAGYAPALSGGGSSLVVDLTAQTFGQITATITTPGTGYAVGDKVTVAGSTLAFAGLNGNITMTVTRIGGVNPYSGYREVNIANFIKAAASDRDHAYSNEVGDIQFTTENGKEQIKVWNGTTWVAIYDTTAVKGWISSLNLFEGTVQEVGGSAIGAVTLAALPDLTDAAQGAANSSHYWVWVGTPGYVIKAGDPNKVGTDLVGAVLQVGDWLQVSSTGGTYRWSHIGGDLLARSRADSLYGLKTWVAGNYEKDSLVVHNGSIYRANVAIVTGDVAPDAASSKWTAISLSAGVRNVATDADLPATAPPSDVYLVLNSTIGGNKPALFSYDLATTAWVELGASGSSQPLDLTGGDLMVSVGVPIGTIMAWLTDTPPPGWLLCDGAAFSAAAYPELAAVLAGHAHVTAGHIPDFRGAFLRGAGLNGNGTWGDAAHVPGKGQEQGTKRPTRPFTTDATGSHHHDYKSGWGSKNGIRSSNWGPNQIGWSAVTSPTASSGLHSHTIFGGGDDETRPVNFGVNWIIKATDKAVRVRTTP